jgi:hypothetical protein
VKVKWGDLDLTTFSSTGMRPQPIFSNLKINLEKTSSAPTLEFNFSPSPPAFQAFVDCKTNRIDQPIVVEIGYAKGDSIALQFFYAGCSFSTGHEMDVTVYGVSLTKGAWTNNRINFTMDKPVPLKEFPALVKEKCGAACKDIKFEFVGKAKDDAAQIQIKHAAINQTPHRIVVDIARANGMLTSINPEGKLVIHYSYNYSEEKKKDKPNSPAKPKYDGVIRNVYIAGPGLLNSFRREQRFQVGNTTFDLDTAFTSPIAFEQDNAKITQTNTKSGASTANQPSKQISGTSGQSQQSYAQSGTVKTAESLKDARAAWAQQSTTTGSGSFFMVPYLVGIKPRDFICIPSLNPNNPYFEDWIVDNVTYEQKDEGGVEISVNCSRPFPGEGLILSEEAAKTVESVLSGLRTTKDWHELYWNADLTPETDPAPTASAVSALPNPVASIPTSETLVAQISPGERQLERSTDMMLLRSLERGEFGRGPAIDRQILNLRENLLRGTFGGLPRAEAFSSDSNIG